MSARGRVTLRLVGGAMAAPALRYEPPADATPLLASVPPLQAPALIRRLYAICAAAQGHASALAVEAALGIDAGEAELAAREIASLAETAREHGLRIALDWARLIGAAPDHAMARAFMEAARSEEAASLAGAIAGHVTGGDPAGWLAMDSRAALADWSRATPGVAARFIAALLDGPGMAAIGAAGAGTLAARHGDHPLLGAALPSGALLGWHVARLIDLCRIPARIAALRAGTAQPLRGTSARPGQGQAEVPCARGALRHEVQMADGRIARYAIVSPTDRAFAAGGPAERSFACLHGADRQLAELAMLALDPCVDYAIEAA